MWLMVIFVPLPSFCTHPQTNTPTHSPTKYFPEHILCSSVINAAGGNLCSTALISHLHLPTQLPTHLPIHTKNFPEHILYAADGNLCSLALISHLQTHTHTLTHTKDLPVHIINAADRNLCSTALISHTHTKPPSHPSTHTPTHKDLPEHIIYAANGNLCSAALIGVAAFRQRNIPAINTCFLHLLIIKLGLPKKKKVVRHTHTQ